MNAAPRTAKLDIERALERARQADLELGRIAMLPRLEGARVQWTSGLIWTRVGGDAWVPDNGALPSSGDTWPSSHIASASDWHEVTP